jgi:mRNA-degrading endonuclease toxin of MazEF toxin-antitoxin module
MSLGPRRGELWSAHIPGQPDDPHQPRPVLIISDDVRNASPWVDDVIVIPIFSGVRPGLTRVTLTVGEGGIRRDSTLYCEEITCLDVEFLVRGPFGPRVSQSVLSAVVIAVRRAIGEVIL